MKRFRRILIILCVTLLAIELLSAVSYTIQLKQWQTAPSVVRNKLGKVWNNPGVRQCPDEEIWAPLPYLGFGRSWDLIEKCGQQKSLVNNRGMVGPDYPESRDENVFTILLTGGSGAERLGLQRQGEDDYLAWLFNQRFHPPRGKSFKILIAANGGYRQPQNLISLMLYHDLIDAVIDLSGYNEAMNMTGRMRTEKVSSLYWDLLQSGQLGVIKSRVRRLAINLEQSICRFSFACVGWSEFQVQKMLKEFVEIRTYHSQRNFERFPETVSVAEASKLRKRKLKGYYRMMKAICQDQELQCSFFIQPIVLRRKKAYPEEKVMIMPDSDEFRRRYLELEAELVDHHSLVKIFDQVPGPVFMDAVHLIGTETGTVSAAYQIEARAIVDQVGKDWKLRAR